ncbi:hypothetical protein CDAR_434501 [Caerostris darwini]|uniref:Uncharacterized protein n=1 Tax=Caerostris darwini TaxID=1538125 RepID=A0AAV4PIE4_9ARAC|nr:hypothetical protein CDAR_434501 [Caerostris darwini]
MVILQESSERIKGYNSLSSDTPALQLFLVCFFLKTSLSGKDPSNCLNTMSEQIFCQCAMCVFILIMQTGREVGFYLRNEHLTWPIRHDFEFICQNGQISKAFGYNSPVMEMFRRALCGNLYCYYCKGSMY